MERTQEKENKRKKINRMISYTLIVFSVFALVFCVHQIFSYVRLVNQNNELTKDLEILKQNSNYLREHFDVLNNEGYYSVYIDGDCQYVDGVNDSISIIK